MFQPLTREEYHERLKKERYGKEDCPFCPPIQNQDHIIWQWKHWFLIYNLGSYSGDDRHIMAIPKEHICFSTDLKAYHFEELSVVHQEVAKYFDSQSYFSFTRETMDSRSVEHLHMHFLGGKLQGKFLRKMLELQGFPIKQELTWEE